MGAYRSMGDGADRQLSARPLSLLPPADHLTARSGSSSSTITTEPVFIPIARLRGESSRRPPRAGRWG